MSIRIAQAAAIAALLVLSAARQAPAHHAFGGEFDPNRPVLLKGKVVKVEWVNPHAWIHVEVPKPDGTTEVWMIEGGSPNSLLRRGVTKDSLQVGTEVVVDGYQARDYTLMRANGRNVTFADGRKLFLGSSGTGAPLDGADPADQTKSRQTPGGR
jgi:Family of unknown function (DUF6152)